LSGITGRKGRVGGAARPVGKPPAQPGNDAGDGGARSVGEGSGSPGVGVKSVETGPNTGGEGGFLADD
jgi:hypothetical protein